MYQEAVITFIDILGFKDLISKSDYDEVAKKLATLRRLSDVDPSEDGDGFRPKTIQFSDSIIRIRPINSAANIKMRYGLVFHELLDLVHIQGELVNHNVCIRGGVSIGDVYFDNETLFGPGFVKAYEMESIYANYPRIVIDPLLIDQLHKDRRLASGHNTLDQEHSYVRNTIRKGIDGIYFIDYLKSFLGEIEDDDIPVFLQNHKALILQNAGVAEQLKSISAKYLWMAMYHNETIARFDDKWLEEHRIKKQHLVISPKEMPLLQSI